MRKTLFALLTAALILTPFAVFAADEPLTVASKITKDVNMGQGCFVFEGTKGVVARTDRFTGIVYVVLPVACPGGTFNLEIPFAPEQLKGAN